MQKERRVNEGYANYIKRLRKERGYSLAKVEELTGISASYIQRMEAGSRVAPSAPIIEALSTVYGVRMSDLLDCAANNKQVSDIQLLLCSNDYNFCGKLADSRVKELVIRLLDEVAEADWDEETKHKDAINIMCAVDELKQTLN